jgi:hypothetical protein
MKSKEELLREEVRAAQDLLFRINQWAITVILSLQTAIYFVRRDILAEYITRGITKPGEPLPWNRYLVGTFGLLIVASIFSFMTFIVSRRYRDYREQLAEGSESGIRDWPVNRYARWTVVGLYYIFPLLDLLIRLYITIEIKLG